MKTILSLAHFAMVLGFAPALAHACSVCIDGANDPTADAFNASVLFLMATPYAVVGSIAGGLFFAHRRRGAKQAPAAIGRSAVDLDHNQEGSGR